jgi:hypothetical protein
MKVDIEVTDPNCVVKKISFLLSHSTSHGQSIFEIIILAVFVDIELLNLSLSIGN